MLAKPEDVGLSSERLARVTAWAQRWVDEGKLPGLITMVARHGKVVHFDVCGMADVKREVRLAPDTIFRFYSMTKPLTSTAIMMLYEEGRFQLDDPIARFLPCFKDMRVYVGGMRGKLETVPAERDITFRDLLTHTSGLTYGFMEATPVDAQYRDRGVDFQTSDKTLGEVVELAADIPLIAQPGAEWNYSIATDVLGHLVAVISGQPFDEFLRERVTGPLGMVDTAFHVPADKIARFAANYTSTADGYLMLIDDPQKSVFGSKRKICSGGGGLVSTAGDYMRFCQMMLNRWGASARTQDCGTDDVQPPARRHGGDGAAAVLRIVVRRHRFRPRLLGHARSGPGADPWVSRRVCVGRCGQHGVLDRSGGRHGGDHADTAHAVVHVSDPAGVARTDLPGCRRVAAPWRQLFRAREDNRLELRRRAI